MKIFNKLSKLKPLIPNCSLYKYSNGQIAILPYLVFQKFKYQGISSIGCVKFQIQMGWLIFGSTIGYNYTYENIHSNRSI